MLKVRPTEVAAYEAKLATYRADEDRYPELLAEFQRLTAQKEDRRLNSGCREP